jgi:predicted  nucleic acid-binding Zn-ribbon protein
MENPTIQTDIAEILRELQSGQKEIIKEISNVKISLEEVKGDIKVLNTSIQELEKRVSNQEFTNRGVLIGLILALLGGAVKLFGFMPNS